MKRLQRPMPEVSGLSRRAGRAGLLSAKRLRRWMQDTARRGEHKDVLPVEHVGHGRLSGWGGGFVIGVGGGMAPPDQQSAALLLAAGVVAADGAALLGFAGWFLLPRTSEEPSNRGAFPRRDRVRRADGSCSCWLSPSRCGDRSDGLRCRRSPSAARARRDPPVGHSGLWPGAMLLGLARCGGAACAVLGASSGRAGSVMRLSCGAP